MITRVDHLNGVTARGTETRHTDLSGRLYGIYTKNAAGTTITRHGYTLDAAGRRTKATRENAEYWEYGYNDRGEVTAGKKHLPNGDLLAGHQFEYEYDTIGNRKFSKSGGDAAGANLRTFDYTNGGASPANELNQYNYLTTPATFDVIGRTPVAGGDSVTSTLGTATRQGEHYRVQGTASNSTDADWKASDVTYTPASGPATTENGHVFVPKAAVTPTYDADGNLTADGRWTYAWDAENRLISMTSLHNDKPRTRKLEFAYDWMGRRIEKKVSDEISSAMTLVDKRRFAYDGWNMIAEFTVDGSGSLVPDRQYTWGTDLSGSEQGAGGVGGLLSVSNNGTPLIACYDGNGNIVAWMNASGTAVAKQEYDPFGNQIIHEGVEMPVGFSTKYKDKETGLLYYGYRYFDPKAGRWLSKDPIGENGGLNLYCFIGNEGISGIDILGLEEPAREPVKSKFKTNAEAITAGGEYALTMAMDNLRRRQAIFDALTREQKVGKDRPVFPWEHGGRTCCSKDGSGFYFQRAGTNKAMRTIVHGQTAKCEDGDTQSGWYHSHPDQDSISGADRTTARSSGLPIGETHFKQGLSGDMVTTIFYPN